MGTERRIKNFYGGCVYLTAALVLLMFAKAGVAAGDESVEHYKMISTVEYTGKSQFQNQVEALFTVNKLPLPDDKVQYSISTSDFDLIEEGLNSGELSFIVDRKTQQLSSAGGRDLFLLEMVNNRCVRSLKEVTKKNIGKTWKQSFNLSFLDNLFPGELKFTLTAIQLKTEKFGEMTAVRALSEPFVVKAAKEDGSGGSVKARINTVYLFDPEIEDIYLSISVFEATTKISGFKEKLRHEVATYKTNAEGVPVDLSGLDKRFEKLVRKVGLTRKSLKVSKGSPLPQWSKSEGLRAAQVANICAATACEGGLNPVATVCIPAARTVEFQSSGELFTPSAQLGAAVGGEEGGSQSIFEQIVSNWGWNLPTAAVVGGVAVGTVAIAGGSSSGSSRSNVVSP